MQLIVCLGYNTTYDYFKPAYFALLDSKTEVEYTRLHQAILNITKNGFSPKIITVDFELAHINVILNFSIFTI